MKIEKNTITKSIDSALATLPHPTSSTVFANGATTWLSLGSPHRCGKDRKLVQVYIENCNGQKWTQNPLKHCSFQYVKICKISNYLVRKACIDACRYLNTAPLFQSGFGPFFTCYRVISPSGLTYYSDSYWPVFSLPF